MSYFSLGALQIIQMVFQSILKNPNEVSVSAVVMEFLKVCLSNLLLYSYFIAVCCIYWLTSQLIIKFVPEAIMGIICITIQNRT